MFKRFMSEQQSSMLVIALCALIWAGGYSLNSASAIEANADQGGGCSEICVDATLVSH